MGLNPALRWGTERGKVRRQLKDYRGGRWEAAQLLDQPKLGLGGCWGKREIEVVGAMGRWGKGRDIGGDGSDGHDGDDEEQ